MRFQRLDLIRYGKFTDRSIPFGESVSGRPDLHIVYGPNEAGKSTSMSAILDLLFGMPAQSPYNFLHAYSAMRIGACLDMGDGAHEIIRIKRPNQSLLGKDDLPLADGILQGALGGMSRDAYRAMFSLDDETLEEGGESILASQGDLGQLLFSASAGLAGFSKALSGLRVETDRFYKPRSRSHDLASLKETLAALKLQRDEIDVRANDYARFAEQRAQAMTAYQSALRERAALEQAATTLEKRLNAIPVMRDLMDLRQQWEPLTGLPDAPRTWVDDIRHLEGKLAIVGTQIDLKSARVAELQQELEVLEEDTQALALEPQLASLEALSARNVTAEIDIPKLQAAAQETDRDIDGILHRLDQTRYPSPQDLLLSSAALSSLQSLMESRAGLETGLEAAEQELAAAQEWLNELASQGQGKAPRSGDEMSRMIMELSVVRSQDHELRIRLAETALHKLAAELRFSLAELAPWDGDADALRILSVPSNENLHAWKTALKNLETQIQVQEAERERATVQIGRLDAELAALRDTLGPGSAASAEATRAERDALWAEHRSKLSSQSATEFEMALRKDDQAWTVRLERASELAKMTTATLSLATARVELERATKVLATTRLQKEDVERNIRSCWLAIVPDAKDSVQPDLLENWLKRRETALQAAHARDLAQIELDGAKRDCNAASARLQKTLSSLGIQTDGDDLADLVTTAQSLSDRYEREKAHLERLKEAENNLGRRQQAVTKAKAERDRWQASWDQIGSTCWFGAGRSIALVRDNLVQLSKLEPLLSQRANLADRIQKMQTDQSIFVSKIADMAAKLDIDSSGHEVSAVWQAIQKRVRAARQQSDLRQKRLTECEDETRALRALQADMAVAQAQKTRFTTHFSVETLDDVLAKLAGVAHRSDLATQIAKQERQLRDLLDVETLDAASGLISELDTVVLAEDRAKTRAEIADLDQRVQELYAAKVKAEDKVNSVGGDDAVARIEESRRTILMDIEDRAINYIRLRSGVLAAEQALRTYRETHRSAMMQRASEAFRIVSRGAYTGLAAQPEKDTEILIALGSDGSSKVAREMSKGTRFQLYLALRMAGYHEYATSREAVPFIADDIMETFDDFRAEETFRLFAEMAKVGQVIYFTHHRHLCEIATQVCPDVRIHSL